MDVVANFQRSLQDCLNVVVFSGAGASAESGIPTFRNGAFSWYQNIFGAPFIGLVATGWGWQTAPWFAWFIYDLFMRRRVLCAEPNAFHLLLGELYRAGKYVTVITQNVDGLHQKGGLPSKNVIELHGTLWKSFCANKRCQRLIQSDAPRSITSDDQVPRVPYCQTCGSWPRPGAVLFNDYYYVSGIEIDLFEFVNQQSPCTTVVVVGLSGAVGSADPLIKIMVEKCGRKKCFLINPQDSKYAKMEELQWIRMGAAECALALSDRII